MMRGNPLRGASYLVQGFKLLNKSGVRRFVAIPLLINTLLFGGLIWFGTAQFEDLLNWLLPEWLDWLRWLLWPLFALTVLTAAFFTFTLVANLLGAPFNGLLASAVERHIGGTTIPAGTALSVTMTLGQEVRKFAYLIVRAIPLLILSVIPVVNLLAPVAWFVFSAWMLTLEYGDYPLGNRNIDFKQQRALARQRPLTSFGFGAATLAATLIPIVNFFVMPAAVAGATLMWQRELADAEARPVG